MRVGGSTRLLEAGGGFAVAAVLVLIGRRIASGGSTVGDFTGFVSALILAAQPIRALGNLNAIVQEAASALQRTFDIMDENPRIQDEPDARPLAISGGKIHFANVSFPYSTRTDRPARRGFRRRPGRTTALVGRSGSGKSTLLSLVPRLYDVTAGAVLIDGQDVRDVTLRIPAPPSRWSARTSSCSTIPCGPISRSAGPTPATRRSSRPARLRRRTISSCGCLKATRPSSAPPGAGCPGASASASRWRALS